jgi:hypothetical protein
LSSAGPNEYWFDAFNGVEIDNFIYRIGNMTLLETVKNREADRKSFDEKAAIYQTSNYKLPKEVAKMEIWNTASVNSRQRDLADKAASVWKINY